MKWFSFCLLAAASASAFAERPERNAFLNYSVHSARELVSEIRLDPEVADRFERHFAMTQEQLVSFCEGLHYTRLQSSGVYEVYSIPPDGHVKMHHQKLYAGVPIFADASGVPILLVRCGNPIIGVKEGEVLGGGPSSPMMPAAPTPQGGALMPQTDLALTPPTVPGDLYVPPAVVVPPAPTGTISTLGGSPNYAWIGAIVVGGGLIYGITSIHGPGHHPYHPPPPVPEPSSYVLLVMGLSGVLLKRKSKTGKSLFPTRS